MLSDLLFVASIFITRIALPIVATCILGNLIERALNREQKSQTPVSKFQSLIFDGRQ